MASLCSGAQAQILGNSGSVLDEAFGARHLLVVCGSSEAALGEGILDEQFREADWPGYAGRGISLIGLSAGIELVFDTASVAAGEVKLHIWHDATHSAVAPCRLLKLCITVMPDVQLHFTSSY